MSDQRSNGHNEQRPKQHRDRVFNAETCRAIRKKTRIIGLASVVVIAILFIGLPFIFAVKSFPPVVSFIASVAFSIVAAVVAIIVLMLLGVELEAERELLQEVYHSFNGNGAARRVDLQENDESEPPAAPALAAGRSGFDWTYILGIPFLLSVRVVMVHDAAPLFLGVCVVIGIVLFLITPINPNTYPVGDSPEGLNRGDG